MERLTTILGEDIKELRIDHEALAERLADIDGLRSQVKTLDKENEQLKDSYESQITAFKNEHNEEVGNLKSQIAELDSKIKGLESGKTTLATELEYLIDKHERLADAIRMLASIISYDEIRTKLGKELYAFLLKDSKVPDMVIDGVGKFIDFRKYLGMATEKGAEVAGKHAEQTLSDMLKE